MKKYDTYHDKYYDIKTHFYKTDNGLRILNTVVPNSNEFVYSLVVRSGSYFEGQLGVPDGTAHFLEHILERSPNNFLPSMQEFNSYTRGNRKRSWISTNASTSKRCIYFYAYGNESASERIIPLLNSKLEIPEKRINDNFEKEKGIITGEIQRKPLKENDASWTYDETFFSRFDKDFVAPVIGTIENLETITEKDLLNVFNSCFTIDNAVVSVKSSKPLSAKQKTQILEIEKLLVKKKSELKMPIYKIDNKFDFAHFKDLNRQGVFFSYNVFEGLLREIDHKKDRLKVISKNLMSWVGFEYLREELNLVYEAESYNSYELFNMLSKGIGTTTSLDKLDKVLEALNKLLFEGVWEDYLFSKDGKEWFESMLSSYIYRDDDNISRFYSENLASDLILDKFWPYNYYEARKFMRRIKRDDIAEEFKSLYLTKEPSIWFVSQNEDKEVLDIFKQSKIYKRFKQ